MTTEGRSGTDVQRALTLLRSGGIIGLPTETVYGLAGDALNDRAVARIFRVKGRPADHPLIVHVPDIEAARQWSNDWFAPAEALAREFWPGPLTLIVALRPGAPTAVTGGRSTVALRIPRHRLALEVLHEFRGGLAAPSANRFGKVSPTTATHVLDDLGDDVDYVLDGGPCEVGVESTIVDCSVSPPQVLRFGSVTVEQIERIIGPSAPPSGPSRAPGMLASHYAPTCRVRPVATLSAAQEGAARSMLRTRILNGSLDPARFAHDLYALLRLCDADGIDEVFVVIPDESDIGRAIRDRVFKAAAGRADDLDG